MDDQQLYREYQDFCRYHVNPPSFDTWLKDKVDRRNKILSEKYGIDVKFEKPTGDV